MQISCRDLSNILLIRFFFGWYGKHYQMNVYLWKIAAYFTDVRASNYISILKMHSNISILIIFNLAKIIMWTQSDLAHNKNMLKLKDSQEIICQSCRVLRDREILLSIFYCQLPTVL